MVGSFLCLLCPLKTTYTLSQKLCYLLLEPAGWPVLVPSNDDTVPLIGSSARKKDHLTWEHGCLAAGSEKCLSTPGFPLWSYGECL